MLIALLAAGLSVAPVTVGAVLHDGTATVRVNFGQDGSEVKISLRGEDGLQVAGDQEPVRGAAFSKGDKRTFEVAFTPGPDQSTLVVEVSGKFGGNPARQTVTQFFRTGTPNDEQRHKARERSVKDSGDR